MDSQETRIYTAAIITAIVVGAIIIYFIISIIRQQRKIVYLHKLNSNTEINAIEKERARVAYDLHDELGPMLSSIKLHIGILEITDSNDSIQIEKINNYIDTVITRIREISYNLTPTALSHTGLPAALKEYINNIDKNILEIDFTFSDGINVSEQSAINVFRIVQEIIHNTIKHASATRLKISFKTENNKIFISLKDDGIGFEKNQILDTGGLGLKSLHSRIQLMNGRMFLDSKRETGTEYLFEIPCS